LKLAGENQSIQKNKPFLKLLCPLQISHGKVHTTTDVSLTIFILWLNSPKWTRVSSVTRFLDHTQQRTTVGRIPLDDWSARRIDLYSQQTDIHALGGTRTYNLSRRAAADLHRRPRGHWDHLSLTL